MSIQFTEDPDSRAATAYPATFTLKYTASGEPDDSVVQSVAAAAFPSLWATEFATLYLQDIRIEPAGYALYKVTAPYSRDRRDTYTFNFDTTGATVKIKCAKEHLHSYWSPSVTAGGTNPHAGAIGVTGDGTCEGADIVVPCLKMNIVVRHAIGIITIDRVKTLAAATGYTNSDSFLGFAPGELLFLGAIGSDGTNAPSEVTYQIAASHNLTGLTLGNINGIDKKGWEYLWVEFMGIVDTLKPATQPAAIHIERVYDPISFSDTIGIS